jgi:hypothetical protein
MHHFLEDIKRLSAREIRKGFGGRKLRVQLRCFILDSIMRYYVFGTCSHSGYFPCIRCHVRGEKYVDPEDQSKSGMYFPVVDAEPRADEHWPEYKNPEDPSDKDKRRLRLHECPLDGTELEERATTIGVIDPMHCFDGNAASDAISWTMGYKEKSDRKKKLSPAVSVL